MNKEGKKQVFVQEVTQIETINGEVISTSSQNISVFEKEPPYVKLYLEDIGRLNNLNSSEQKVINELVFNMGFNNVVPSYKPVKELIAKRLGMQYNTLDKAIKELNRKGILIRQARGLYIMDPNIFGRGSWRDVKKIRMTIEYAEDGTKRINTEVSKQLGLFGHSKED